MALEVGKNPELEIGYINDSRYVIGVIKSCKHAHQLESCRGLINNYKQRYPGSRYTVSVALLEQELSLKFNEL